MQFKTQITNSNFFNNTLLLIDVHARLNPNNKNVVAAITTAQGQDLAKLMKIKFTPLILKVDINFTNVTPINAQFLKGFLGDLPMTTKGAILLHHIHFTGCGDMVQNMWKSIVRQQRNQYIHDWLETPKNQ